MTVLKFRKVATPAVCLADNGTARISTGPIRAVSISANLPCDTEPRAFHASHGLSEAFVNGRALDSAHGIYAWVGICFAFDAALIAAGMWVFG